MASTRSFISFFLTLSLDTLYPFYVCIAYARFTSAADNVISLARIKLANTPTSEKKNGYGQGHEREE
jgi:hypothetical protein